MYRVFLQLQRDEHGLTLVEYGIGLSIVLGIAVAVYANLGTNIGDAMGAASVRMPD
ncbi:Flp family type IVb pilin [Marimonas sp. MJW-29]|uniref:Flp family type IVb pilin n=1 Tax=Sulfitobacter sediminis TaxID=3234186 RepID=A0ABV3RTC9_9RHOB